MRGVKAKRIRRALETHRSEIQAAVINLRGMKVVQAALMQSEGHRWLRFLPGGRRARVLRDGQATFEVWLYRQAKKHWRVIGEGLDPA